MVVAPYLTAKPHLTIFWWLGHRCTLSLAVCCFLELGAWSLTPFCPLAIFNSAFPSFLAGVSHRDVGIDLGTFPTPWFAWALSAGILAVLSPLLDWSKACPVPVCIPLCLSRLHGVGCGISQGTEICFDLLHFLPGLHWWEVQHGLNGCVLSGFQYYSH